MRGIALVDDLYAACGAAGVAPLLSIAPLRLGLGLTGARSLHSAFAVRLGAEPRARAAGPRALRIADGVAATGMIGFGGALGWSAVRHD